MTLVLCASAALLMPQKTEAAVQFVRSNSNAAANATTISTTINVAGTGTGNRILLLDALAGDASDFTISSVVFDPGGGDQVTATELWTRHIGGTDSESGRFYILEADLPASGTYTVTATFSGDANEAAIGALLYQHVNQRTPFGTLVTDATTADPYTSPSVTGADGGIVVDTYWTFKPTAAPGGTQTIRASEETAGGFNAYYATEKTLSGQTSTTFTYNNQATGFSDELVWGAAALRAARQTLAKPPNNLGLVGYWSFNEGTSTVATDFSGNGNHGTLTSISNPPTATSGWTNGKRGKALNFDGGNDWVDVPASSLYNFDQTTSTFTVSAWVKASGSAALGTIASNWHTSPGADRQWSFETDCNAGSRTCTIAMHYSTDGSGFTTILSTSAFSSGSWHHIVATSNIGSDTYSMYIDGRSVSVDSSPTFSSLHTTNGSLDFGSTKDGTEDFYAGSIDELRIYNRVLGPTEVAKLYGSGAVKVNANSKTLTQGSSLENGLVGLWTFDGPDLTDKVYDRSGSNNHGYFNGGATSSAKVIGKLGQALFFDGSQVDLPDMGTVETYPFSFAGWFRTSEAISGGDFGMTILSQEDDGNSLRRVQLYYNTVGEDFCWNVRNDANEAELCISVPQDDTWHHAVGVSSSATDHRLYIDGALANSDTTNVPNPAVDTTTVGNWNAFGGMEWHGLIDDVRIYNRALSPAEVAQLYKLGTVIIRP